METYLIYIGKVAIAAGAFYIAFLLLFQNQKHFSFNRIYLPVSLALSFVIPLITFTTIKYIEPANFDVNSFAYLVPGSGENVQPVFVFEWYHYLFGLYILGVAGFLFYLSLGHFKAINIIQKSRVQKIFDHLVNITKKDVHPFSFFSKIVVSEKTLSHPDLEMIVSHENIHVREKHTIDILFTEIIFLFQWFNPFAWLIKDAVKNNLEYKTDNEIAKKYNPQTYQLAMVTLADKQGIAPFLTALNGSQLKNRIIMMKKKTENKYAILKQFVVLPLLAVLVMGLANREVRTEIIQPDKQFEIIVDGKKIPHDDPAFRNIDFSKGLDGREIILALGIEEKVISNGMNIESDGNNSVFFIRTNEYISGSDPEFDRLNSFEETEKEPIKTNQAFYAINDEIVNKANFEKLGKNGFESVVILSRTDASDKYGHDYKSVIDAKTGKANFKITSENVVKGKVINEKDEPIPGASIIIRGKTIGTITNNSGEYEIRLEDKNEVLVFTKPGYLYRDVRVKGREKINVLLYVDKKAANEEVIVNGFATKQAADISNKIANDSEVRINSNTTEPPLYVVDGVETDNIEVINPNNIENIDVLKGESGTKLYGEKGKNGVVLITTKNASKNNSIEIKDSVKVVGYGSASKIRSTDQTNGGFDFGSFKNVPPSGNPVIIIDGKTFNSLEDANVQPDEIASISVLKNESASTKIYGEQAKNGVIIINTKTKYNSEPGEIITQHKATNKQGDPIFYKVDEMPEFPGGETALRNFLANEIKYPEIAHENGIQGKVYVTFIITKKGKVTDAKIARGLDPILDKEALRVIETLPDWKPGKQRGEAVNVSYTVPVYFELQETTDKQAIYDLRVKIAQSIKYPVEAQENNQQGVVEIWAFIEKDGTISNISEKRPDGKFINIDEVVVTSLKSEKAVTSEKSNNLDLLVKESKRVIEQLSPLKIQEVAGETVSFRIRFVLQ